MPTTYLSIWQQGANGSPYPFGVAKHNHIPALLCRPGPECLLCLPLRHVTGLLKGTPHSAHLLLGKYYTHITLARLTVVVAFAKSLPDALEPPGVVQGPEAVLEPHVLRDINHIAK